jgi:hypothetical protein
MKKYTGWPIEENIDSVIVFDLKYSACVLEWVEPKRRRVSAFIRREMQIKVGVLLEGDTRIVLVTAEVPKNLWKCRTGTEFF